jgi:hypothetical protein
MECISLENDGDKGTILNLVLNKFVNILESLELLEDSKQIRNKGICSWGKSVGMYQAKIVVICKYFERSHSFERIFIRSDL